MKNMHGESPYPPVKKVKVEKEEEAACGEEKRVKKTPEKSPKKKNWKVIYERF